MTLTVAGIRDEVLTALHTVTDPEVDRPITELGYVRSILVDDEGVAVHLRLPTADRSPNFAYLVVSDALDAVRDAEIGEVRMLLDDHHQVHVHDHLTAPSRSRRTPPRCNAASPSWSAGTAFRKASCAI